jgi:hypothetical protein
VPFLLPAAAEGCILPLVRENLGRGFRAKNPNHRERWLLRRGHLGLAGFTRQSKVWVAGF